MVINLALRLLKRELQQGQLGLIIFAIALAVLAVSGLSAISERLQLAINGQAAQFIAADRIIESPEPLKPSILQKASSLNIKHVSSMQFNSMVYHGEKFQLVTVRAVSNGYPLKGQIELATRLEPQQLPRKGEIWYESRLKGLLNNPELIELGISSFRVTGEIKRLPDAGFNPFASSPVVLMRLNDVASTNIIQPGSRVNYRYQFVGSTSQLSAFENWVKPELFTTQKWIDVKSGDTPIASAIKRAENFLLLASLFGIALACTAIGISAQRYCQRHYDVVAMMKTFGASNKQIKQIFSLHLLLVSLLGIALGLIGGRLLDFSVGLFLPAEVAAYQAPIIRPMFLGLATGLISAFGFSSYPLMRLLSIPPLRVIQGQLEGKNSHKVWFFLLGLLALGLLGYLYSQSLKMTLIVLATSLLLGILLSIMGYILVYLGYRSGMKTTNPLQLALAGLRRRAKQNTLQLVGFSSALALLLTILLLRNDLLNQWQQQLPDNAPNYFAVNITPDDKQPFADFLKLNNISATDIYPVVRGRLVEINGETLISKAEQQSGAKGRIGIDRQLNLTWRNRLPSNNALLEGEFNQTANSVSIETKVMKRLGLKLGDTLTYKIDNQILKATITSIRSVQWESMQPNFFMILTEQALSPFAATAMASIHVDENQQDTILALIKQFPTISIIDVSVMIDQLQEIIAQVSLSLTLLLALVMAASALVLIAQTEAGMSLRQKELAVLRTFGASGWLLKAATSLEFALLGAIAGLLALIVAEFSLFLLKTQLFELKVGLLWQWWILAPLFGAAIVALLGLWRCRKLLNQSCKGLLQQQ